MLLIQAIRFKAVDYTKYNSILQGVRNKVNSIILPSSYPVFSKFNAGEGSAL